MNIKKQLLYKKYILVHPVYPKSIIASRDQYKKPLTRHFCTNSLKSVMRLTLGDQPYLKGSLAIAPLQGTLSQDRCYSPPASRGPGVWVELGVPLHCGGPRGSGTSCPLCLLAGPDLTWTSFWATGLPWGPGPHAGQCPGFRLRQLLLRRRECGGRGPPGHHPACPR